MWGSKAFHGQECFPRLWSEAVWQDTRSVHGFEIQHLWGHLPGPHYPSLLPEDLLYLACGGLEKETRLSSLLVLWNWPNSSLVLDMNHSSSPQCLLCIRSQHYLRDLDWAEQWIFTLVLHLCFDKNYTLFPSLKGPGKLNFVIRSSWNMRNMKGEHFDEWPIPGREYSVLLIKLIESPPCCPSLQNWSAITSCNLLKED